MKVYKFSVSVILMAVLFFSLVGCGLGSKVEVAKATLQEGDYVMVDQKGYDVGIYLRLTQVSNDEVYVAIYWGRSHSIMDSSSGVEGYILKDKLSLVRHRYLTGEYSPRLQKEVEEREIIIVEMTKTGKKVAEVFRGKVKELL